MGDLTSPMQVASVANALLWPLAAGIAVVAWSKVRAAARARRDAALDEQLQDFFQKLEAAPAPPQLSVVVEALEEGGELNPGPAVGPRPRTPARP